MLEKLIKILDKINVSDWRIISDNIEAGELFFVKDSLDMNRIKEVDNCQITVYQDFEENNVEYRGSASINIYPTMDENKLEEKLNEAALAAAYVRNKYYPLADNKEVKISEINNSFSKRDISDFLAILGEELYKEDKFTSGGINSSEIFLNKIKRKILNSRGVEREIVTYNAELEIISNWHNHNEEIELYNNIEFSQYQSGFLSSRVKKYLKLSKERSNAISTPELLNVNVLLTGEPVKEFLNYYYAMSNAKNVYEKISDKKPGESIQGEKVIGDRINLTLDPLLYNSTLSTPFDNDGYPLKKEKIISDGILQKYWGNIKYSHYLDIDSTGEIKNMIFEGGEKEISELKSEKYLELIIFSDFQTDPLTGNFAGEIRLGRYFDGKGITRVTGGSISGNIKEVEGEMYLSKEIQELNNFRGPRTIKLKNINISTKST